MRKTLLILLPIGLFLIFTACKKSSSDSAKGLTGPWAFLGGSAQIQSTSQEPGGITMVTNTNYLTKNNTGTITFNRDSMIVSDLGYSVDTTIKAYFYYNGAIYDSASQQVSLSIPPTSATAKYTMVGTDSLYFPNGGILSALDSMSVGQGSTYVLKGDSLAILSQSVDSSNGTKTITNATLNLKRK
jgi:hypothetical protein